MSHVAGVIIVHALIAALTGESAKSTAVEPVLNSVESAIVRKTNAERAKYGRSPLTIDASLLQSARRHAQWMTHNRTMHHASNGAVAENIAMGQRSSSKVIRTWMNSPGHRANILNSRYRRIGVAAYRTSDGRNYWCQQFLR